jgi:hypothetical protein
MSAKQRAAALRNLRKARGARTSSRRRKRTNPVGMYLAGNPKRRKRRNPSGIRRFRRRRNPGLKLSPRGLMAKAMPALIGGGGAVANDLLYNFALGVVPATVAPELVANLRTGPLRHVGKAASALLLSMVAGFVLPRRIAEQMGTGALVVVGYNVVRDAVAKFAPNVAMGMYLGDPGLGWAGAGWNPNYGRDWSTATRSGGGMGAFLRRSAGSGGLDSPPQFKSTAPFTSRAAVYADELE